MTPSPQPEAIIAALAMRGLLEILDTVCNQRGVTRDELCGRGRTHAVAAARHELWWFMRHHPDRGYSYSEIGRIVGRDHATILHGVVSYARSRAPRSNIDLPR